MKYIVTVNNNNYEVEVERGVASVVKAGEDATPVVVAQKVVTETPAPAALKPAAADAAAGENMAAPMPGTILQIKKNPGDSVKKNEVVFILEAMKMESEIYSPVDGTITQILTSKGAHVATGDLLAVIR